MHIQVIYRAMCLFCTLTILCAFPLSTSSAVSAPSAHTKEESETWTLHKNERHRQKRQITSFLSNNDFIQSLSQTFGGALGRIRDVVSSGAAPESPWLRMVNEFSTRVAPAILRSVYMGASQNVWDQIRNQARNTINDLFDRS